MDILYICESDSGEHDIYAGIPKGGKENHRLSVRKLGGKFQLYRSFMNIETPEEIVLEGTLKQVLDKATLEYAHYFNGDMVDVTFTPCEHRSPKRTSSCQIRQRNILPNIQKPIKRIAKRNLRKK